MRTLDGESIAVHPCIDFFEIPLRELDLPMKVIWNVSNAGQGRHTIGPVTVCLDDNGLPGLSHGNTIRTIHQHSWYLM
jgi:hypothetical protein